MSESETKRTALALAYGHRLLEAVHAPGAPVWLAELPAVEALRRIWVQQYYRIIDTTGEKVIRREVSEQGSRRADPRWCPPTTLTPATARNAAMAGPAIRRISPKPA